MAPGIPKAVQKCWALLEQKGLDINMANISQTLNKAEMNALGSAMRSSLCPEAKTAYQGLKSDEDRRSWLQFFVLDPQTCSKEGFNVTKLVEETSHTDETQWVTKEQLASILSSEKHAEHMISSLPSRPHAVQSLADEGIKQYQYTANKVK